MDIKEELIMTFWSLASIMLLNKMYEKMFYKFMAEHCFTLQCTGNCNKIKLAIIINNTVYVTTIVRWFFPFVAISAVTLFYF